MRRKNIISPTAVIELRELGLTYKSIGELLAKAVHRPNAYQADSCSVAVARYKKGIVDGSGKRIWKENITGEI
jgi:hypothetical protein